MLKITQQLAQGKISLIRLRVSCHKVPYCFTVCECQKYTSKLWASFIQYCGIFEKM